MSANEPAVLPAAEYEALTDTRPAPVAPARGKVDRAYYWMIIPVLVVFGFFITLPALIGAFFSFTNYAGYGDWEFIGFTNYINIFQDPTVLQPYLFTFFLAIVCTIMVNIVGMAVALGLNAKIKWRTGIRGIFFIPMVMSALIVAYVFNFLFSNSLPTIADESRHHAAGHQHPGQREVGVAGHRHRHRLAGRARHHHHLPGRAAGHPDRDLRGRRPWTAPAPGGSSAASRCR